MHLTPLVWLRHWGSVRTELFSLLLPLAAAAAAALAVVFRWRLAIDLVILKCHYKTGKVR